LASARYGFFPGMRLYLPTACSTGNAILIPVPGALNRPASLTAEKVGSTMAPPTWKRIGSVRMSGLSSNEVVDSPVPVPQACMMVAPVTLYIFVELTAWPGRAGYMRIASQA
jgi:hypothetical protein